MKFFKQKIMDVLNHSVIPTVCGYILGRDIGAIIAKIKLPLWELVLYLIILIALLIYDILSHKKNRKSNVIKIKYHNDNIDKISKIDVGDWIDLRAAETVEMKEGDFKLISLGVSMKLPDGYEAHVVPRSSTFKKWGIIQTNHMGVIDNSYSGDNDVWKFPAYALRDTTIKENDRICQFRIVKKQSDIQFAEVDKLKDINRGGFGSTGKS